MTARLAALAAAFFALAAVPALAATNEPNPVPDSSFESPADGTGVTTYPDGGTLGTWSVSGPGGVDHVGSSLWQASDGDLSVDLNGTDRGEVSEQVPVNRGVRTHLQVHFALAGNFYGGPTVKTVQMNWAGKEPLTATRSFDTTGATAGAPNWVCPTYQVSSNPASFSSIPVTFTSLTDNPSGSNVYGPVIDDVRIVPAGFTTVIKPSTPTVGQGARKFMLVVKGTNFDPGYFVSVSNADLTLGATQFIDSSRLAVPVTVPADEPTGQAFDLTVTGGTVSEFDTCGKSLSISPHPQPTSVSPTQESQGSRLTATIHGTNFKPGSQVGLGGGITVGKATFNSSTGDLSVTASIDPAARVGSRTVSVRTPDGGVGICTGCFNVLPN
jgi:hypothetical protein